MYKLDKETDMDMKELISDAALYTFKIIDDDVYVEPYFCKNYKSATEGEAASFINDLLSPERDHTVYLLELVGLRGL